MKKELFVALSVFAAPLLAQQSVDKTETKTLQNRNLADAELYIPLKAKTAVSANLSTGPNGYSTVGVRTYVWAEPNINTITFTHRNDNTQYPGTTSGHLRYDVSTDGGANWNLDQGPIWEPAQIPSVDGTRNGPARYPQGGIYNPIGNTNPDSAYLAYFAPTLNGSNVTGSWGGQILGSIQLSGNHRDTIEMTSDASTNTFFQVADDFTVVSDSGTVFGLNTMDDGRGAAIQLLDTFLISKGRFNPNTKKFDYNHTKLGWPFIADTAGTTGNAVFADARIAFSPDGSVGYLTALGYLDDASVAPYGVFSPTMWKTTDGGKTWSSYKGVNLDNLSIEGATKNLLDTMADMRPTWTINALSTAFEHDLVVDKNGNPHMIMNIGPSPFNSIPSGGTAGTAFAFYVNIATMVVDIHSKDGGATWTSHIVDTVSTFDAPYGPDPANATYTEYTRPQIARTTDGSVLFYAYGDTDQDAFGTLDNFYPDIWVRSLDVTSDNMGLRSNMTNTLQDKGSAGQFALTHLAFDINANGEYLLPAVGTQFTNDDPTQITNPVQYRYYDMFYDPTSPFGLVETEVKAGEIASIYPNPAGEVAFANYTVKEPGFYQLEIANIAGVVLQKTELGNLASGKYKAELDATKLKAGVYLVSLKTGNQSHTLKWIVQ